MPQLWEPKDLLKAMKDHEEVNLRHIATRRDKGLLEPDVKAERPGERTKYGAFNALLYVVATKFEKAGFPIEAAYHAARNILTLQFIEATVGENHLWIAEINNRVHFPLTNEGSELPWQFQPQRKADELAMATNPHSQEAIELKFGDKEELPPMVHIEAFVKLIPTQGVYLFAPASLFSALPKVETIRFHNVSRIVLDSVTRLNVDDESIKELKSMSRRESHIKIYGTENINMYDFG